MHLIVQRGDDVPGLWAIVAVLAVCAAALGCDPAVDGGGPDDASVGSRTVERTVRIGLMRVAERALHAQADGSLTYGDPEPLAGVDVCVVERRDAYDSFAPFEPLEPAKCATSAPDETVHLNDVPADSDLIITYTKDGYEPLTTTFRTDAHDVAVPTWADNMEYFTPMLREGAALPWLEAEPEGDQGGGLLAVWVVVTGEWSRGASAPSFGANEDPGVAQAEGVRVEISDANGDRITELLTRRDRPLFLRVPAGAYAVRFTHDIAEVVPWGVQEQFMITGLPTAAFDTIEVPVRAGRLALAGAETYCPLPADGRAFEDLATCTLGEARAAAVP